jgi:hypothetical protein
MSTDESTREQLEIQLIRANISKLMAETEKLIIERQKMGREWRWYPVLVTAAYVTALVGGAVALFLKG